MQDRSDQDEKQARALFAQGDFGAAETLFQRLATQAPRDTGAQYNWGVTLAKLERFEEAMACYRSAIALNPSFAPAYANFGFCLNAFNLIPQARQAFAIARQLAPEDPVPRLNEGIAALALGDYPAGWQGFAARWELPAYAKFKRSFSKTVWQGEDLAGRTLFLYPEQGFGDTIHMARYIPLLAARDIHVIVEAQPALTRLMESLEANFQIIEKGAPIPAFDSFCALMDLPGLCGTTLETIPAQTPYLFATDEHVEFYRNLAPYRAPKRAGIAWAGRATHENDANRSLSFAQLAPLLNSPQIEWVSLQRLVPDRDKEALAAGQVLDWGQHFVDFAETAAAIMTLDLVMTVDTAIAHLAGALGKEVWILLPFYADWRWLVAREDSPWYPDATLFRQKKRGDWAEVITQIGERIGKL